MKARTWMSLAVVVAAAAVTACQTDIGGPREVVRQTGYEGQWIDDRGVGLSTFAGGRFVSIATDTGNRLSEGTYIETDARQIEISMTSLLRETQTKVNCKLVTADQMKCTMANGTNFVLNRRASVS